METLANDSVIFHVPHPLLEGQPLCCELWVPFRAGVGGRESPAAGVVKASLKTTPLGPGVHMAGMRGRCRLWQVSELSKLSSILGGWGKGAGCPSSQELKT